MRTILTILAVLALPSAALAQMQPGQVVVPNRFPTAQAASGALHGITVSGSATKKIPATRARISLMLFTRNNATTIDAAAIQPIVDALVKAGVPRENVFLPASFGSPAKLNNATIVATVDNPTIVLMQSGIASIGAAIAQTDMNIGNVQVALEADNCGDTVDALRGLAIKNARMKAEETAKQLQVRVGGVLNVISNDQISPSGICASQYYVGGGNNGMINSPEDYVSVPVYSSITITYAIKN